LPTWSPVPIPLAVGFSIGLTLNFGSLPASTIKEKKVGGFLGINTSTLYRSDFTLEIVIGSASLKFEIRHNGVLLVLQKVDSSFVGTSE
jgi:hypothetical protein